MRTVARNWLRCTCSGLRCVLMVLGSMANAMAQEADGLNGAKTYRLRVPANAPV